MKYVLVLFKNLYKPCIFSLITLFSFASSTISVSEAITNNLPTFPIESCQTEPTNSWTPQEKWVWDCICRGEIADFNKAENYGGNLDPKISEVWPKNRILRPQFLETVVFNEHFRSSITRNGVCIRGAWFTEPLNLSNAILNFPFALESSRFEEDVYFSFLKTSHLLYFAENKFLKGLYMTSVQIDNYLIIEKESEFTSVDLNNAIIGGNLILNGAKFRRTLNMNSLKVKGIFTVGDKSEFSDVTLLSATIGGQMIFANSEFTGNLIMDSLEVKRDLSIRSMPKFAKEVNLQNSKIGGQLDISGSIFFGKLNMNGIKVDSGLFIHEGSKFAEVDLDGAKIGRNSIISNSKIAEIINMNETSIEGNFTIKDKSEVSAVTLIGAKIEGQIIFANSEFTGDLIMDSLEVKRDLLIRSIPKFAKEVNLQNSKIGGQLDISGSIFFGKLNMNGIKVGSDFLMQEGSKFVEAALTGAKIGRNLEIS